LDTLQSFANGNRHGRGKALAGRAGKFMDETIGFLILDVQAHVKSFYLNVL
jgi:hypothetical protein